MKQDEKRGKYVAGCVTNWTLVALNHHTQVGNRLHPHCLGTPVACSFPKGCMPLECAQSVTQACHPELASIASTEHAAPPLSVSMAWYMH